MLIYVRESEREAIMEDKLSIDEQIPKQLQSYFKTEAEYRDQIFDDENVFQHFKKCYLLTEETFEGNNWDGHLLS